MQKVRTFVFKLGSVVTTKRKTGEFRFLTPNNLETHNICIQQEKPDLLPDSFGNIHNFTSQEQA
jgi:hypothetical protein